MYTETILVVPRSEEVRKYQTMKIHYTLCWNEECFELCNVRCSEEACFKQIVTDMT